MRKREGLLVVALTMLIAACSGPPNNPEPAPTTSACPARSGPSTLKQDDFILGNPETCEEVLAGEVARAVRTRLERDYAIEVVMPLPDSTYACTKGGVRTTINGQTTPALGFCDGNKVFVVTFHGITQRIHNANVAAVWYVLATEAAPIRFGQLHQQLCAAGYITSLRPGAKPADDLNLYKSVVAKDWSYAAPAWQYILYGQQAALGGQPIEACQAATPIATPSTAQPSPSTTESGRFVPAALRLVRSTSTLFLSARPQS